VTTIRAGSIRFKLYPQDHLPRHAHGLYGEIEVIVNLEADGTVTLAKRDDAIQPRNAKRNAVKRVLKAAVEHFDELVEAWEEMHHND
jgi:hypothetical protein